MSGADPDQGEEELYSTWIPMTPQRWTDEMLDQQAQAVEQLLEGQRMLVQIYQQEHDARIEADRRFNRFIERTERFMERTEHFTERTEHFTERTERFMERTERFTEWAQQILASHEERFNTLTHAMSTLTDAVNEIRRYIRFNLENGHGGNGSEGPDPSPNQGA